MENKNSNDIEISKKESIGLALCMATFLITIVFIPLFLFAPVSHYLGKWNDWWLKEESSYDCYAVGFNKIK